MGERVGLGVGVGVGVGVGMVMVVVVFLLLDERRGDNNGGVVRVRMGDVDGRCGWEMCGVWCGECGVGSRSEELVRERERERGLCTVGRL